MSEDEKVDQKDRECLLTDYREAGEDARYRDRLLYNSYYLAIILLVFVVQTLATLIANGLRGIATIVLFGSGLLYLFLIAWAVGVRRSRNNAWKRRENIENEFEDALRTNEYAALKTGKYKDGEKGLRAAYEYARQEPRLSEIPNVVHRADIDFVGWLLVPVAILSFFLSGVVLFSDIIGNGIRFWVEVVTRLI